jgi:DNA-binding transcriptional LysR family regulator
LPTDGVSYAYGVLDIRKLLVLRAIHAEGSIAGAARRLQYTRSAVSQQLSALERETGGRIVERAAGRVTITPVGLALIEHTERILVELRAADAMLESDPQPVGGLLRVGVPFGEGPRIMSRSLRRVRQRFPDLEIRLGATTDEAGADEVKRGTFDMVILSRYGAAQPRPVLGLREWILGSDPIRLCVSPDHPLADAKQVDIAELRTEPWVVCPAGPLGQLTLSLCATAGYEPTLAASVNDVATAIGLVSIGWGITIAPELTPSNSGRSAVRLPLTGISTLRHSVLVVRDGEHLSPRIAASVAAVREISAQSWPATTSPVVSDDGVTRNGKDGVTAA